MAVCAFRGNYLKYEILGGNVATERDFLCQVKKSSDELDAVWKRIKQQANAKEWRI